MENFDGAVSADFVSDVYRFLAAGGAIFGMSLQEMLDHKGFWDSATQDARDNYLVTTKLLRSLPTSVPLPSRVR